MASARAGAGLSRLSITGGAIQTRPFRDGRVAGIALSIKRQLIIVCPDFIPPTAYICHVINTMMATAKPANKSQKPLRVKMLNASGQEIEGIILSGQFPEEDPTLAIARELGKHKHLKPTPVP